MGGVLLDPLCDEQEITQTTDVNISIKPYLNESMSQKTFFVVLEQNQIILH